MSRSMELGPIGGERLPLLLPLDVDFSVEEAVCEKKGGSALAPQDSNSL